MKTGGDYPEETHHPPPALRTASASHLLSTSAVLSQDLVSAGPFFSGKVKQNKTTQQMSIDSMFVDTDDEMLPGGY